MKVKFFYGGKLEEEINKWLDDNKYIEIIDIKYSTTSASQNNPSVNYYESALVIYSTIDTSQF